MTVAIKLFNSLVSPVLEYGSEVWASSLNLAQLDKLQIKFIKRLLHVRQQTTNLACLCEVGEMPLSLKISQRIVKFYLRIKELPSDNIVKQMYHLLENLDDLGYHTWATDLKKHCSVLGIDLTDLDIKTRKDFPAIKKKIKSEYAAQAISSLSDNNPKLRTYRLFKTNFSLEPYLHITILKYRVSLSKFRLSSHRLQIEVGRYTRPKTPVEDRLCKYCEDNAVEDEMHFLLTCNCYSDIRSEMLGTVQSIIPEICNQSPVNKFVSIVASDDLNVLYALGKFLWRAEQRRKNTLV